MISQLKKDLLLILLLLFVTNVSSQQNDTYLISNIGYGRLLPHKSVINHLKSKPSIIGEFGLLRQYNTSAYHKAYNKPSTGINVHLNHTGNKKSIGNGYALDFFGILPLSKGKNPLQFKTAVGIGYIERPFHSVLNTDNNAIGSFYNVHIKFNFEKLFYLNERSRINTALAISHFSNAATQMPNYGLNFIHLAVGYEFSVTPKIKDVIEPSEQPKKVTFNKWNTSINLGWGIKENNNLSGNSFNVYAATLRQIYRVNLKSSFQGAINLYQNYAKENETGIALQTGISMGYFLNFEKLKTGISMGVYTSNGAGTKIGDRFYHKYVVEYQITKKLYTQILLKSHWAAADFFNLTIGFNLFNSK